MTKFQKVMRVTFFVLALAFSFIVATLPLWTPLIDFIKSDVPYAEMLSTITFRMNILVIGWLLFVGGYFGHLTIEIANRIAGFRPWKD